MRRLRHLAFETVLFGLIVIALVTWHVGPGNIADVLGEANVIFLVGYLFVSLMIAVIHTYKWQVILHSLGHHVHYAKLFVYRLVGYSVGYLTPTTHVGSEPIRAILLQREGIPTNEAFSNVIIDKSVELMSNVAFFFLGALLIVNSVDVAGGMKLTILSVSLLAVLVMGMFIAGILSERSMFVDIFRFFRLHKIGRLENMERNLAEIEWQVEEFYRTKRKEFVTLLGLILVLWVLMYLEYRFALLVLGHDASVVQVFLILTGVGIAYSIPIPAAMGTLELGQLSAAKVLNLSAVTGIALAFLIRARDLIWTVLGLLFLALFHFDFIRLARQTYEYDKKFEKGKLFS